jgi:hypothetical protein
MAYCCLVIAKQRVMKCPTFPILDGNFIFLSYDEAKAGSSFS